eukprot:jgi/Tetstr1/447834/TSEL_003752.t1
MAGELPRFFKTGVWKTGHSRRRVSRLFLVPKSGTNNTYSIYEGKIRVFAESCIDAEGISSLDCNEATCVRYLASLAERGAISAGSLQPYLSTINTFMRHTGQDDAPSTGPAIVDMNRALQFRHLTPMKELRRSPCRATSSSTTSYGNILRYGSFVVC